MFMSDLMRSSAMPTHQLSITYVPENTTQKGMRFESTDDGVATVSESGLITAVAEGICEIIVTSTVNPGVTARCTVNVTKTVRLTGFQLDVSELDLEIVE